MGTKVHPLGGEAAGQSTPCIVEVKMSEAMPLVPHMPSWHGQE